MTRLKGIRGGSRSGGRGQWKDSESGKENCKYTKELETVEEEKMIEGEKMLTEMRQKQNETQCKKGDKS